jgi:phospholipid transport system transporter-binding protein
MADVHTLTLPLATTIDQAAQLREEWTPMLAELGAGELQVQAGSMQQFDTSALALLLDAQRTLRAQGGHLSVHAAPAKFVELAALYGVDALLFERATSA